MHTVRVLVFTTAIGVVAGCGTSDGRVHDATSGPEAAAAHANPTPAIADPPAATAPAAVSAAPAAADRPAAPPVRATQVVLDQAAVWPAPDVVFATPEEAAEDFVSTVLGVTPVLGPFQQGDSLSGEIEVFSESIVRGVLFLRQIRPTEGWYVIAAASDGVSITSPDNGELVIAGPLQVRGAARGFEGTVVASAFPAGDASAVIDQQITRGGALADTEPYDTTLDLAGTAPGDVVAVLVRGDTGLETDPGEFAILPVVITAELPASR